VLAYRCLEEGLLSLARSRRIRALWDVTPRPLASIYGRFVGKEVCANIVPQNLKLYAILSLRVQGEVIVNLINAFSPTGNSDCFHSGDRTLFNCLPSMQM